MAISRHTLSAQIVQRTDAMIVQGLVEETKNLMAKYPRARALGSIGYAEARQFLAKEIDEKAMRNAIIEKTRQLAKRQLTWIRSDAEIRFVDGRDGDRVAKEVENLTFVLKETACNP
jgi:tRNA dimethylallyltransferase